MVTITSNQSKDAQDAPRLITPTTEELQASLYNSPNIQAALEALHQDGFVVLKNVVNVTHVENINAFMTKEADDLLKSNAKPFNQGVNCRLRSAFFEQKLKLASQYSSSSTFEGI
jgi:hypothetical protein